MFPYNLYHVGAEPHEVPVPSFGDLWWSLPQDLQGRILGEIDDERREFHRLHTEFPPQRPVWVIKQPVSQGTLKWFSSIAPSLEHLDVLHLNHEASLFPEMLALAAAASPQLEKLSIKAESSSTDRTPRIHSAIFQLTQLTSLELDCLWWPTQATLPQMHSITALQRLKKLTAEFSLPDTSQESDDQPDQTSMWAALSKLNSLDTAALTVIGGVRMTAFLQPISLVTQLRSLGLVIFKPIRMWEDAHPSHPATLSALTQLTALHIALERFTFPEFIHQIWSLPSLKHLCLKLQGRGDEQWPTSLHFQANQLTSLVFIGHAAPSVTNLLYLPALRNLRFLDFGQENMKSFPAVIAAALESLNGIILDMQHCVRLPSSVSLITTLSQLQMRSRKMNLQGDDIKILESLPGLRKPSVVSPHIVGARQSRFTPLKLEVDATLSPKRFA